MADSETPPSNTPPGSSNESTDEEQRRARDELRAQVAVQTVKDLLWRFDEASEGTLSIYEVLSFLAEELVAEGCCAACIQESVAAGFEQVGADPLVHRPEDSTVLH